MFLFFLNYSTHYSQYRWILRWNSPQSHIGMSMMTSSNGKIVRVTGHLCREFTVTRNFGVFFDLRLNDWLSKQSWGWLFEMQSRPLWRHSNAFNGLVKPTIKKISKLCIAGPLWREWTGPRISNAEIFSCHRVIVEWLWLWSLQWFIETISLSFISIHG